MCVGAGGCADGTERQGVGCWAGSEKLDLMNPTQHSTQTGLQACCSLKPLRCCQRRVRCVCRHVLRKTRYESYLSPKNNSCADTEVHLYTANSRQPAGGIWVGLIQEHISHCELDRAFLFMVPAAAEWAGPWSRGGGGGRPGEDVNSVPELARDGGRRGPEDAEPLAEGVGGLMEDEEDPTAEADDGGFTGVLLLKTKNSLKSKNGTREEEY